MCLAGTVVAYWSLIQEVVGSRPFTVMTNTFSLNSLNSVKTFRKNVIRKACIDLSLSGSIFLSLAIYIFFRWGFAAVIFYANYAFNFLLYSISGAQFRKSLKNLFARMGSCRICHNEEDETMSSSTRSQYINRYPLRTKEI